MIRLLVQAASLAILGNRGDEICGEDAAAGDGFTPDVCKQWEQAVRDGAPEGLRQVVLRISFVLGTEGGALRKLASLARWFVGGTVGNGRQYISWLHIDDMDEIFVRSIFSNDMVGAYNTTGPGPVTNADFMRRLRSAVGRPWSPPTPKFLVHLGSFFMQSEAELALNGRRGVPTRLVAEGFSFRYPELQHALGALFGSDGREAA